MKKIKITEIDPRTKTQKGLFGEGCYGSSCQDECCEYGCDVDLTTLKLIYKHKDQIEPLIKAKVEDCFATELKQDDDYIGGAYRETAVRKADKTCKFRLIDQRGCSLFYLWAKKGLPKKIVPTICRVYPITWHRGRLFVDTPLRTGCKCKELTQKGAVIPSLFETQKKEIMALFDIQEKGVKAAPAKKTTAKPAAKPKKAAAVKTKPVAKAKKTVAAKPKKAAAVKTKPVAKAKRTVAAKPKKAAPTKPATTAAAKKKTVAAKAKKKK